MREILWCFTASKTNFANGESLEPLYRALFIDDLDPTNLRIPNAAMRVRDAFSTWQHYSGKSPTLKTTDGDTYQISGVQVVTVGTQNEEYKMLGICLRTPKSNLLLTDVQTLVPEHLTVLLDIAGIIGPVVLPESSCNRSAI